MSDPNAVVISVAVVAHPSRKAYVDNLLPRLDAPAFVAWDIGNGQWDTATRALTAYDPRASHHLVLEDDALPCADIVAGLEQVVARVPESIVSCYIGSKKPAPLLTQLWAGEARSQGACLIPASGPQWGVGLVFPTPIIDALVAWGVKSRLPYDDRVASFDARCCYTYPPLVDHRAGASVYAGRTQDRRAITPPPASALDVDWSGPIVRVPETGHVRYRRLWRCWWCGYGWTNARSALGHRDKCRYRDMVRM